MNKIPQAIAFVLTASLCLMTGCGPATQAATSSSAPSATPPRPTDTAAAEEPAFRLPLECTSPATLTVPMTEGPYFTPNSPERTSLLEPDMPGEQLLLTGYVVTTDCKPVAHALLDFWQADADGQYDNSGYRLRGHQFTDETGHYQLTTVIPGLYPGRTEHIHVKVQALGGPLLTTQLFFPGVTDNETDGIFDDTLLIMMLVGYDSRYGLGIYNFVVNAQ